MVLESLIAESNVRRHPLYIFFLAFIVAIGSIVLSYQIFPKHASVLSVAFITIALVPLIYHILSDEEEAEANSHKSFTTFFARHFNLIMVYVWLFVGIIAAYFISYAFFSFGCIGATCDQQGVVFEEQIKSFCSISGDCVDGVPFSISGRASALAAGVCQNPATRSVDACAIFILENNGGVLIFTILLSILFGAGAIFIIAWNASILGVFFGEMFLSGNIDKWFGLLQGLLLGHGPPELLGYVFGALAGAVLSAMIARGKLNLRESEIIFKDIIFLGLLGLFSVVYGAATEAVGILGFVEVYYAMGLIYLLIIVGVVIVYGKRESFHGL